MSMLDAGVLAAIGGGGGNLPLIDIITNAGLTTGLKLSLDAGDVNSYAGSGQKLLDRSGGLYDFFLGADGTATTDDPLFNGTGGDLTSAEYFSFDGGDYFRYDNVNEVWMDNLHKNNAKFSFLAAVFFPVGSTGVIFSDAQNVLQNSPSINCHWDTASARINVSNGSVAQTVAVTDARPHVENAWNIIGGTVDEAVGVGGSFFWCNGAYAQVGLSNTFDGTYSAPSAANAAYKLTLGGRGDNFVAFSNGVRLAGHAMWEGVALSKADLDSIYAEFKNRFGL